MDASQSPFPKFESAAMQGWTTADMWKAVTTLAHFSHSMASHTQLEMAKVWEQTRRFGPGATELPNQLQVQVSIEQETGRLINDPV